ncbi:TetR family transcriptional regulator [Tomitella fengzijianii]|uniref:TetR family transcriptional regulator n=1 Tax=Tomitella fengzijianii TaxID=2597660 RepID=A0A516X8Q6_9ACTN|nr:TetR family transcriptional regulator [Tomitella fengzijianii]
MPAFEPTRRHLSAQQAATVESLTQAAVTVLRGKGYSGLTIRLVAADAGVAPATAYTYFSSKNHLMAEAFWRRLAALPETSPERTSPQGSSRLERVASVMRGVALLVSDEPELSSAVTAALLGDDPEVRHLRIRIGMNIRRRLSLALRFDESADSRTADGAQDPGGATDEDVLEALETVWAGGLVRAGMGHQTYHEIADRLETFAGLILSSEREGK